ncbi:hypothetical protein E2C01_045544 [Portunus trituberculatus]|uniref:Uncharacterized protein n=1 Tax=Portunus trituberculatus TaxID=210409 RepID=A0A5B7FYM0_PORTR|nr:hypothetical protein [Portunus trituberculatus]
MGFVTQGNKGRSKMRAWSEKKAETLSSIAGYLSVSSLVSESASHSRPSLSPPTYAKAFSVIAQ